MLNLNEVFKEFPSPIAYRGGAAAGTDYYCTLGCITCYLDKHFQISNLISGINFPFHATVASSIKKCYPEFEITDIILTGLEEVGILNDENKLKEAKKLLFKTLNKGTESVPCEQYKAPDKRPRHTRKSSQSTGFGDDSW